MLPISQPRGTAAGVFLVLTALSAPAGELKVDINRDSKNLDSVTETGYVKWSQDTTNAAASGTNAVSRSFVSATGENVVVTFAQTALSQSRGGTGLLSNWYQTGAQGTARLVSDGITVAPADMPGGGEIRMTIAGLSAGAHTLLAYHNVWDARATGSVGPLDVFLNGTPVIAGLQPSIRAATNAGAPVSFLEFSVSGPAEVTTVLFSAGTAAAAGVTIRNVMINGFEIDTPDATRIAIDPRPGNGEEHVDADSGTTTLAWSPPVGGNVTAYDVYLGTSATAVKAATTTSPEFLGNQAATTRMVSGLLSHLTYYWRIDVRDAGGNPVKGAVWYFRPRHLAFPGAEGAGRFARGGRGGTVAEVTSLADYTGSETPVPGTFRYAVKELTGPRTIVFSVSGLLTLRERLTLSDPYVTVAGQTAPGKGICLRQFPLGLSGAKDAIIRHIRNRAGNVSGLTIDGGGLAGCDHSIMDHCSISWSIDEAFSSRSAKNITLQRTLISEALNIAGHQNYPAGTRHGYAASIGGDIASFHHNLLAHCEGRNWSLAGGLDAAGFYSGRLDIRNNVVYNWGHRATDGGAHEVNFVNNYYKPGPATGYFKALNAQYDGFPGTQQYYFAGNVMPGRFDESTQSSGRTASDQVPTGYSPWVSTPFFPDHVNTQTAGEAYRRVLCDVGCNQPVADDHDVRVIRETRDGTTTYHGSISGDPGLPDSQDDVGGWEDYGTAVRPPDWDTDHDGMPDHWESATGSDAGLPDNNDDPDGDGFTRLEDYLNFMAGPHRTTGQDAPVDIPLTPWTAGFTGTAAITVSGSSHGTAVLLPDGPAVRFTPAAGFTGLAGFSCTLTGNAVTIPLSVPVLVTGAPADLRVEITGIRFAGGIFTVDVGSTAGADYQLESTDTLAPGSWQPTGAARAGTGGTVTLTDSTAGSAGRRFYRVRAVLP